jgi:hypothetical protein
MMVEKMTMLLQMRHQLLRQHRLSMSTDKMARRQAHYLHFQKALD